MDVDDNYDTHLCLGCHVTIEGLDEYVQHKRLHCPAMKQPNVSSGSSRGTMKEIVVTPGTTTLENVTVSEAVVSFSQTDVTTSLACAVTTMDVSIPLSPAAVTSGGRIVMNDETVNLKNPTSENWNDFFSSLQLQSKGVSDCAKDQLHLPEKVDPEGMKQINSEHEGLDESFDQTKTLRIVNILNDIDFGSDSEGFLPSDEDWMNFSDDEEDTTQPPRSHTGGKWKPGTSPVHANKGKGMKPFHRTGKGRGKVSSKLRAMELQHKQQAQESVDNVDSNTTDQRRIRGRGPGKGKQLDIHTVPEVASTETPNKTDLSEETESTTIRDCEEFEPQPGLKTYSNVKSKGKACKKIKSHVVDVIECAVCDRSFNNKYNFVRHLTTSYHVSRERGMIRPYILNEKFQALLLRRKPFQCRICGFYCNAHSILIEHMISEKHEEFVNNLIGPQFCTVCKYTAHATTDIFEHFKSEEHCENLKTYDRACILRERRTNVCCQLCDKKMHSAKALADHMTAHHRGSMRTTKSKYRRKSALFSQLCPHCKLQCANAQVLKMHIRRKHSDERPYRCSHCAIGYADSYSLKIHMLSKKHLELVTAIAEVEKTMKVEPETKSDGSPQELERKIAKHIGGRRVKPEIYRCHLCKYSVDIHQDYRKHYETEHRENTFWCDLCGMYFLQKTAYESHIKRQYHFRQVQQAEKGGDVYSCEFCPRKFYTHGQLQMHEHSHTLNNKKYKSDKLKLEGIDPKFHKFVSSLPPAKSRKKLVCPDCHKVLGRLGIIPHLRKHSKSFPFSCVYCSKGYTSKMGLSRHLHDTHMAANSFACNLCDKYFRKNTALRMHKVRYHADSESIKKALKCHYCEATFIQNSQLKDHLLIHEGKPLKCTWEGCRLTFRYISEVELHSRVHTGVRPYLCDQCGYAGKTRNQMTRHSRTHTGERRYPCEYCNYRAINSSNLRRHMRIHIGVKPYKCHYCKYTVNTLENLRKHILTTKKHTGLRVYPCKLCDYGTDSAIEFSEHITNKHKINVKDTDIITVYSGIYDKTSDVKKVPEGNQAIPTREKLIKTSSEKPKTRNSCNKPKRKTKKEPKAGDHNYTSVAAYTEISSNSVCYVETSPSRQPATAPAEETQTEIHTVYVTEDGEILTQEGEEFIVVTNADSLTNHDRNATQHVQLNIHGTLSPMRSEQVSLHKKEANTNATDWAWADGRSQMPIVVKPYEEEDGVIVKVERAPEMPPVSDILQLHYANNVGDVDMVETVVTTDHESVKFQEL